MTEVVVSNDVRMINSMVDPRALRHALGCFATGVAIVTVAPTAAAASGVTINLTCPLSDPSI